MYITPKFLNDIGCCEDGIERFIAFAGGTFKAELSQFCTEYPKPEAVVWLALKLCDKERVFKDCMDFVFRQAGFEKHETLEDFKLIADQIYDKATREVKTNYLWCANAWLIRFYKMQDPREWFDQSISGIHNAALYLQSWDEFREIATKHLLEWETQQETIT